MHGFTRSQPGPDCLDRLAKTPGAGWSTAVREGCAAQVRLQLYIDQDKFCAYCEEAFEEKAPRTDDMGHWTAAFSHVDHFRPRWNYGKLIFAWDNMLLSCESTDHCGKKKDDDHSTNLIDPSAEDPLCFIFLTVDGELQPRNGLCGACIQRAVETIRILGLNAPALVIRRREALRGCRSAADGGMELTDYLQFARDYQDLILDAFGQGRHPVCACAACQAHTPRPAEKPYAH